MMRYFNPHSHEGSDRFISECGDTDYDFNPHSHEGSDGYLNTNMKEVTVFQSTLPRRERLQAPLNVYQTRKISIHTPTKGATEKLAEKERINKISIHTPTKGATIRHI